MMEMKIKIEVPDLAAAIEKLAACVNPAPAPLNALALSPPDQQAAPAPDPTPAAPVPSPMPTATPQVMPQTPGPADPAPDQTAAPPMPVTAAPSYTLDQISRAGVSLMDAGKTDALLALLGKYGIQAITQLQTTQYGAFATELRALGAQI